MEITTSNLNAVGHLADKCDNLLFAASLPLSHQVHNQQLIRALQEIREEAKRIFIETSKTDPWDNGPER